MAIYIYTNGRPGGEGHIPSIQEWGTVRYIMNQGFGDTKGDLYQQYLHMPGGGYIDKYGIPHVNNGDSYYRTSSVSGSESSYIRLVQNASLSTNDTTYRASGYNVRLFLSEYFEPDNTWTLETQYSNLKIYHNNTLGLLSLYSDNDHKITMLDKNVGATTVRNTGDALTVSNVGKFFQRGNYYGFSSTLDKTSSTQVDTTGYGGDNPYDSDIFITANDRSNPSNNNLRTDSKEEYFVIE